MIFLIRPVMSAFMASCVVVSKYEVARLMQDNLGFWRPRDVNNTVSQGEAIATSPHHLGCTLRQHDAIGARRIGACSEAERCQRTIAPGLAHPRGSDGVLPAL